MLTSCHICPRLHPCLSCVPPSPPCLSCVPPSHPCPPFQLSPFLSSEQSPTISPLMLEGWIAVEVVVEDSQARKLIPAVKRLGGTGVFTYDVQTIVH